ncbi:putative disease resistance protein [Camellia lanceoleosa]|uniref:Disease resistance protein n=1 Tax=Camellia lanceoleosa TaxID=1840588 RepID=A0ACC0GCW5_9ERIC|nr:putative disease resistance protein [Camellia lanceoleosa]
MVVLGSSSTSLSNIQCQIADQLGLKLEGETLIERAACLCQRLANAKRILLALDEVSEELDLEAIGIYIRAENRGCKVVLTSEKDVICSQMGAQKKIQVKPLTKEEAWHLFKEMAGDSVDAPDIRSIAEQVVTECLGLPLALRAIGRVLKNKSNFVWTEVLKRLRVYNRKLEFSGRAEMFADQETWKKERAGPHLRLSYDSLEDEETKSLFLLCCLYPACRDIHIEELVRCGMGLRIFKDINGLEEARNRVQLLVDQLKSYCL